MALIDVHRRQVQLSDSRIYGGLRHCRQLLRPQRHVHLGSDTIVKAAADQTRSSQCCPVCAVCVSTACRPQNLVSVVFAQTCITLYRPVHAQDVTVSQGALHR